MFELDQSIAEWRRQMSAGGIKSPAVLDELESHLRDDLQRRLQAGSGDQAAFESAARQIGHGAVLQPEFAKVRGPLFEQLKQLVCALAGIPDYQLATNMNTANPILESRWAAYLKAIALILPAILFWMVSIVKVLPKLKEICMASGTGFPKLILTALALSDLLKRNLIVVSVVMFAVFLLLEWRSRWWPRYRRAVFGIGVFLINTAVLILIMVMAVQATIAGAALIHPAQ